MIKIPASPIVNPALAQTMLKPGDRCLDEDMVFAFIEGRLSASQSGIVEQHVDSCDDCRLLLSEMARVEFASSRREGGATGDPSSDGLTPSTTASGYRKGETLGERYRVIRMLGKGAMGAVYEVRDLQLDERVALKLLRPELEGMPLLLDRLHHEIVLGRRITHPNVCRLHDIGSCGDTHFITMELVHGSSLDRLLARELPGPETVLSVLLQVCAALEAAHERGVVHRDLKPANIMMDEQGKVTVMDFGLARDLRGDRSQSGMLVGSPFYWSPEQARGERATERSDIHAVGVIACELFGAQRGTPRASQLAVVPEPYRAVIERCLAQDPEDRYPSAGALRDALLAASVSGRRRALLRWGSLSAGMLLLGALVGYLAFAHFDHRVVVPPGGPDPSAAPAASAIASVALHAEEGAAAKVPAASRPSASSGEVWDAASRPARPRAAAQEVSQRPRPRRVAREAEPRAPQRATVAEPQASERVTAVAEPQASERVTAVAEPRALQPQQPSPQATAEPAGQAAVAEKQQADERQRALVERRLALLELERQRRGILETDLRGYRRQRLDAQRAVEGLDLARAEEQLQRLTTMLADAQIDEPFVARKLARLNALLGRRKLDPKSGEQVRKAFARVHERFFAGDYRTANRHLNTIWQILHGGANGR